MITVKMKNRRGLSLMELLLVLAVLSAVVAISWPALRRPLNRSHVQSAAQQLQRVLLMARRAAMESGQIQRFQYQPESGIYYWGPQRQFGAVDLTLLGQPPEVDSAGIGADEAEPLGVFGELPTGAMFSSTASPSATATSSTRQATRGRNSPDSSGKGREASDSADDDGGVPRGQKAWASGESESSAAWTRPLKFYPSGRMESAQIELISEDGYKIVIAVEGLAGRVKIGPPQRWGGIEDTEPADNDGSDQSRPQRRIRTSNELPSESRPAASRRRPEGS